ncbi:MAG: hypothetical protein CMI30_03705 [Opitutae bacterium]|nr:hypothetical protein [Opitutae bacterium]
MKLLHREDVEEAGYDMPSSGICASISEFDLEELKYAGEWIQADDEVVVADGHEQQYLYVVIAGQVDVYKRNDQASQHQHIASISEGDAFGEMAFLSGGVASADVQATGQVVLWRIDHERLLEFVGQHRAGGQLCLNVASILSNRLVGGNRKLVDLGKQLQDSMQQLQVAVKADATKGKALRQMQSRVKGVTHAFQGKAVAKKEMGGLGIAAMVVAGISLVVVVILLATRPDGDAEEQLAGMKKERDEVEQELLEVKGEFKTTEDNLAEAKRQNAGLTKSNDTLTTDGVADRKELNDVKSRLRQSERVTKELMDEQGSLIKQLEDLKAPGASEAAAAAKTKLDQIDGKRPPDADQAKILQWARSWKTLAFPRPIKAMKTFSLKTKGGQAQIPISVGKDLFALGFNDDGFVQVGLKHQPPHTYLQSVPVRYTNFIEAVTPFYESHTKKLAEKAANTPTNASPFPNGETKPPTKPSTKPPTKPVDTSDHGNSCVCSDCRKKKKGGSLFPDLPQ